MLLKDTQADWPESTAPVGYNSYQSTQNAECFGKTALKEATLSDMLQINSKVTINTKSLSPQHGNDYAYGMN